MNLQEQYGSAAQYQRNDLSKTTIRAGLIGAGAIGRHHARVLSNLVGIEFVGLADSDSVIAQEVCQHTGVACFEDAQQLMDLVDVLFVATPTVTHFEIVAQAISQKKNVLVEKPLTNSVHRAHQLVEIAKESGCHCVVGHVERFNSVVRWFRQYINPADILSINITRVGPRPPRVKDVGIIIDLAVHDIDLIAHLCESPIADIRAVYNSTNGQHEDVAQISLKTESGAICGINTNWLTPYKSRKIEIATAGAFYVGDLVAGSITKYQSVDPFGKRYIVETHSPKGLEPLVEQALSFFNLIRGETDSANATFEEACRTIMLATQCLNQGAESMKVN